MVSKGRSDIVTRLCAFDELIERNGASLDALSRSRDLSTPFLSPGWLLPWSRAFAHGELRSICVFRGDQLIGALPVVERSRRVAGRDLRILASPTNEWSFRYELLGLSDCPQIGHALAWQLTRLGGQYDAVELEFLPTEAAWLSDLVEGAMVAGWRPYIEPTFSSPFKRLPESWSDMEAGLKSKFRNNLERRMRRLSASGTVRLEVQRHREGSESAFQIFCALESSSWKGGHGTAIQSQQASRILYEGFVEHYRDDVWIPILWIDQTPIAAQLIVRVGPRLFLLKTGYDPAFRSFSPGQLVTRELIRMAIDEGVEELDFLGEPMTWKADWAPELRQQAHVHLFAPTVAGMHAYWAMFGLRQTLKQVPALRKGVTRWRAWRR